MGNVPVCRPDAPPASDVTWAVALARRVPELQTSFSQFQMPEQVQNAASRMKDGAQNAASQFKQGAQNVASQFKEGASQIINNERAQRAKEKNSTSSSKRILDDRRIY